MNGVSLQWTWAGAGWVPGPRRGAVPVESPVKLIGDGRTHPCDPLCFQGGERAVKTIKRPRSTPQRRTGKTHRRGGHA